MSGRGLPAIAATALVVFLAATVHAQPDPRQMSGIPRPVNDLPNGSVTVLVVKGSVTNGLPGQTVEMHVGSKVQTATTNSEGRAQFDNLPAGETLKADTVVDGERLESQEFPAPAQGGIRLLLAVGASAAGNGGGAPAAPSAPAVPAVPGQVKIGGESRIIIQPGDESVAIYYLLDVVNDLATPVNPTTPFVFDMPPGATGTTLLQGTSALASVDGTKIRVSGPIPPGTTLVEAACEITVTSGTFDLSQRFPASLDQFALIVKKIGDIKVSSPQLVNQRELAAQGETYIAGNGVGVGPGQPLTITVSGLPHHSPVPMWTSLGLALGILLVGLWVGRRRPDDGATRAAERKRLVARREKLFGDLVRLERERASGGADDARYAARRRDMLASLEHIYGALDADGLSPDPGNAAGVAA